MKLATVARGIREIAVVFLGATLLFLIQPIAGQRLLASYGGSPSVWLATLLFFQAGLFLGYTWGFLVSQIRSMAGQAISQMFLLCLTVVTAIPVDVQGDVWIASSWKPMEVVLSLSRQLLLPVVCLGSVSPLIQSWGARVQGRRPPYWLYAVSNLASLLALVAYPFFLQPHFDLVIQQKLWTSIFLGFVSVFAWNVMVALFSDFDPDNHRMTGKDGSLATMIGKNSPDYRRGTSPQSGRLQGGWLRSSWLLLAFLPSMLLMAVTNQITSDVAAGPLFWTLPLAAYLATFTFAFAFKLRSNLYSVLALFGLAGIVLCSILSRFTYVSNIILLACGSLFVVCLELHRQLARLQPEREQLSAFYLWVSAGGLLGGIVSNLVAPLVFSNYYELEFTVVLSAITVFVFKGRFYRTTNKHSGVSVVAFERPNAGLRLLRIISVIALVSIVLLSGVGVYSKWPYANRRIDERLLAQQRTFHGVFRVIEKKQDGGTLRVFGHGWTDHGSRWIEGPRAALPSGYYAPGSGAGLAFEELRRNETGGLNVCVLGLGAGSLLCWKEPQDRFVFVEIDPVVVDLQQKYFGELNEAGTVLFEVGDGRKYLETTTDEFDLIVLDAFTGDSVPAHLLTIEAMSIYLERLKLDGLLAVNISNRYLDFYPVLEQLSAEFDLDMAEISRRPELQPAGADSAIDRKASDWALISRVPFNDEIRTKAAKYFYGLDEVENNQGTCWRDDFTPVLPLLK